MPGCCRAWFLALLFVAPLPSARSAQLFQSADGTSDRLTRKADVSFQDDFPFEGPTISVQEEQDQEIIGFGGAFTEAAAVLFQGLSKNLQEHLLDLYWGEDGIGFSVGRVHINSCDFSPESYSFDDVAGDVKLEHFDTKVTHDLAAMIPFMKAARKKVHARGYPLKLIAAPWSPPAWMKTNGAMDHSRGPGLKEEAKSAWAAYFSKWISGYESHGLGIWAVTPQNEPENDAVWEACLYTAAQEVDWVARYLGPTLKKHHPEVKIFIHDHNKDHMYAFAEALRKNPSALPYVSGVAFHWYSGDQFDQVAAVHRDFPSLSLLATEATYERYRWRPGTTLESGDWNFGLGYAHDIMGDLNAGATGWIDWNLMLDFNGGPNHVNNVCDAAVLTNSKTLVVHPQYYAMGHFSKFVLPSSRRLLTKVLNSRVYSWRTRPYGTCTGDDGLQATAFLRPDGNVTLVVLNCAESSLAFKVKDGASAIKAAIPARAIQTYVYRRLVRTETRYV